MENAGEMRSGEEYLENPLEGKIEFTGGEDEEVKIKQLELTKPAMTIDTGGATIRVYDKNITVYKQHSGSDVRYSLLGKEAAGFIIQEEIDRHQESLPEDERVLGVYNKEKNAKQSLVEKGLVDPKSDAVESAGYKKQAAKIELKNTLISKLKEASEFINSVN